MDIKVTVEAEIYYGHRAIPLEVDRWSMKHVEGQLVVGQSVFEHYCKLLSQLQKVSLMYSTFYSF